MSLVSQEVKNMSAVSIEVFMSSTGICLAMPRNCGLEYADTLLVDAHDRSLTAVGNGVALSIELPNLSSAHCQALIRSGTVAVGEFNTLGVVVAYTLGVKDAAVDKRSVA